MFIVFILLMFSIYAINQTNSVVKRFAYFELKAAMQEKLEKLVPLHIFDVREQDEVNRTGMIPGSVHVPREVESALKLPPEKFQLKYHTDKPKKDENLVFVCKVGTRSYKACRIALKYKYKNVINYEHGWLDWNKKSKRNGTTTMNESDMFLK